MVYRNQLQMQVNQESAWLNQLQSQKADPKAKEKIDAQVNDRREAYHQALLRPAHPGRLDHQRNTPSSRRRRGQGGHCQRWAKGKRDKPKLGPSHDFLNNVKLLEKLEKAESAGDAFQGEARTALAADQRAGPSE